MQTAQYARAEDWQAGTLSGLILDTTVNVSAANHPALVPDVGSQVLGTPQPGDALYAGTSTPVVSRDNAAGGGGSWYTIDTFMVTATAGDRFTCTAAGGQVVIQTSGITPLGPLHLGAPRLTLAAVRQGGLVQLEQDGVRVATMDLARAAPQLVWHNPDGASHTLRVTFLGTADAGIQPIGPVTQTVGTSLAPTLTASTTERSYTSATWRLLATTAGGAGTGQYSLYHTPQGGTESLVAANLAVGTTYDGTGYVPTARFAATRLSVPPCGV